LKFRRNNQRPCRIGRERSEGERDDRIEPTKKEELSNSIPQVTSETVEKVPKEILVRDAERNDLTECTTINDLIITRGHETPENHPFAMLKGFSTVSPELFRSVWTSSVQCFEWKSSITDGQNNNLEELKT